MVRHARSILGELKALCNNSECVSNRSLFIAFGEICFFFFCGRWGGGGHLSFRITEGGVSHN